MLVDIAKNTQNNVPGIALFAPVKLDDAPNLIMQSSAKHAATHKHKKTAIVDIIFVQLHWCSELWFVVVSNYLSIKMLG